MTKQDTRFDPHHQRVRDAAFVLEAAMSQKGVLSPETKIVSGFAVELSGRVVWLTASHCIWSSDRSHITVSRMHDFDPNLQLRFHTVSQEASGGIEIVEPDVEVHHVAHLAKETVAAHLGGSDEKLSAIGKLFDADISFGVLSREVAEKARSAGLEPFVEDEIVPLSAVDDPKGAPFFLSGIPVSAYSGNIRLLHEAFRPVALEFIGPLAPDSWSFYFRRDEHATDLAGSVVGMSGGPITMHTADGVRLAAVQSKESFPEDDHVLIGTEACELARLFGDVLHATS